MNKILLPVDGSKESYKAASYAMEIASKMQAIVDLVHVLPFDSTLYAGPEGIITDWGTVEKLREEEGRQLLERTIEKIEHANVNITTNLKKGDAIKTILDMARAGQYGMIVMGSRGRCFLEETLYGSVSNEVARSATCPVLIVH